MITLLGASGLTGGKIAQALLQAGERVRVVGRSPEKLAALQAAGAEPAVGDATDVTFLTRAFGGASAVYTLVAADPQAADYRALQDDLGESIAAAVRASGVRHVVALSSLGADRGSGSSVIAGLHAQEERLRKIPGANILLLRPASFFENCFAMLPLFRAQGIFGDGLAANLPMPMVATRDIAAIAAEALRRRDWSGVVVRELLGPRDITMQEIARLFGTRIGQPELAYVPFSNEEVIAGLIAAGFSESFAHLYAEMINILNEGRIGPLAGRHADNTTPTDFADFADQLAAAFRAGDSSGH